MIEYHNDLYHDIFDDELTFEEQIAIRIKEDRLYCDVCGIKLTDDFLYGNGKVICMDPYCFRGGPMRRSMKGEKNE